MEAVKLANSRQAAVLFLCADTVERVPNVQVLEIVVGVIYYRTVYGTCDYKITA